MSIYKKIAIISAVFPPYKGGIGNVAENHARILSDRGCDVTVFTPTYAKASAGRPDYGYPSSSTPHPTLSSGRRGDLVSSPLKGEGVSVMLLKSAIKYGNAAWVPHLCGQLKDFDTVILEYPFYGGMRAVYKAKKKYGFKLIVFYHMDTIASGPKGMVFAYAKKFFLPRIVKIADIVIASSHDYAKHSDLGKYWKENDAKFKVLPIGVDILRFKPACSSSNGVELNSTPNNKDEKIILFVGGLDKAHYFKGVEYLIRAIPLVSLRLPATVAGGVSCTQRTTRQSYRRNEQFYMESDNHRNGKIAAVARRFGGLPRNDTYKVVIVGRGELQDKYRELGEQLGVKDRVIFTGGVSDDYLIKLYQTAYVTVLPSIDQSEAFGIVLVESMACGVPVIASNLPGVRSVFEDGITGLVSRVKDEKDIAEKISYILNNPQKHSEMSHACAQLVAEKYDWNRIGDALLKLVAGN